MRGALGISCQVTSFHIDDPPDGGVFGPHEWMAVAIAHVFDPSVRPHPLKTEAEAVLSGEAMRTLKGRGSADTEIGAMRAALDVLMLQVKVFREKQSL